MSHPPKTPPVAALTAGFDRVKRALVGQHPLLYIVSWEEARVETMLRTIAASYFGEPLPLRTWTIVDGLRGDEGPIGETRDPFAAIDAIVEDGTRAVYLMKDFPRYLIAPGAEGLRLVRRLRDAYRKLRERGRYIFFLSPHLHLPEDLKKEVNVIDFDLPGEEELGVLFRRMASRYLREVAIDDETRRQIVLGMKGLTVDEATHLLHKVLSGRKLADNALVNEVLAEKEQISRKEGVLEFVPPRWSLDDIGGLENLKGWLQKRAKLFTAAARDAGIPPPRGILLMGMSGCGKSLSVKAISSLWNLPLFRLDINRIFSGDGGQPELLFERAIRTAEAVAPCVLWIDEVEMGVAGYREGDGGATSRIFSTFLTWMQEKREQVFVAATANRIHLLPAEIIRKGRFDQVFFVDLPSEGERKSIFAVHLRQVGIDPAKTDLLFLAKATKGWNGAEIEQCVSSAVIDAFSENRLFSESDLYRIIGATVPLSVTMEEQMKAIKSWAHDRAVSASKS
jgi:ATP-dependent 26S proteasome regulatory subunit